jgi:hypothetical protein
MTPGFYWVRHVEGEDWEPAMFNGEHWVFLGAEVGEEPEIPSVIGNPIRHPFYDVPLGEPYEPKGTDLVTSP